MRKTFHSAMLMTFLSVLSIWVSQTDAVAVMSIDLGSEYIKIAIVKPGVPMEIVLNKESLRKTPVVVSFRDGERTFGDPALSTGVKFPAKAYWYLREILGKKLENPIVQEFAKRFPYYKLVADDEAGTTLFQHNEETAYSVEELMAMVLQNAKELAETYAEQPIKDAVITVPVYFNQAERRTLLKSAELAGLNVLQLMNHNSAVALNYGIFRRKAFNSTSQFYMFYDMGATSTTATIVGYKMVQTKENGYVEKNPQLSVKGVGFDRHLGGLEVQLRLREHLAKLFNEQKKTSNDVTKNARAMAKLFKEAGRVKLILSANSLCFAQVESLLDDQDFKAKVTREELEAMCEDLFERVANSVNEALKSSQMTMSEISEVILMGGGTRVPKVQELLKKVVNREELGKSINTDEAAALGAVYQAAYMTKGFKVKKFGVKDANLFPIQVEFDRTKKDDDIVPSSTKLIKRTLFGKMNPFPQKKVMTFNKHIDDFSFAVNYGDLSHLSQVDIKSFDSLNLTTVKLTGVADALNKHSKDKETESKGIKAHFRMDESGILSLDLVESLFEKQPSIGDKEEESTLSKLGSTISNFFSGQSTEDKEGEVKSEETKEKEKVDPTSDENKTRKDKSDKVEPEKKNKNGKKPEKKEENKKQTKEETKKNKKENVTKNGEKAKADNKTDDSNSTNGNNTEKVPPKPVKITENITQEVQNLDLVEPSKNKLEACRDRITSLKKKDEEKVALQVAKNEFETFLFEAKDRQTQEIYEKSATEEEREKFGTKLSEATDWLEYEAHEATTKETYKEKLKALKSECKDWYNRVAEHNGRPKAFEALKDMLNYTRHFYKNMENFTGEDKPFTKVEHETLSKLNNETEKWRKAMIKSQKETPLYKTPVVKIDDIALKLQALDREVKYLVNKVKSFVPPKPKPTAKESNETKASNETKSAEDILPSNETKSADNDGAAKPPSDKAPENDNSTKPSSEGKEAPENDNSSKPSSEEKTTEGPNETQEKKPPLNKKEKSQETKKESTSKEEETLELPPAGEKSKETVNTSKQKDIDEKTSTSKQDSDKEKHKEL